MVDSKDLIRVCLGKEKADLVILNGSLVNVYSGELLHDISVAIKGEKIAFVGKNIEHTMGKETEVIDASDKIVAPGFIDSHFHLFMPLDEFIEHSMPHGTTTVFMELDLAGSLGYEAGMAELNNMSGQPIRLFGTATLYTMPPFLKQEGLALSMDDYQKLLEREDVVALGETMWISILNEDIRSLDNIATALDRNKVAEGHGSGAKGNKLVAFSASGVSSCHESTNVPEAMDRLRLGLYVMIREGSIRRDLEALSRIKKRNIDFRRLCLVTDGLSLSDLLEHGHMDSIVQKAIDLGIDPIKAFQMTSINPAEHFGMSSSIGGIAPGKYADMVILPSLTQIECQYVISQGKVVARDGKALLHSKQCVYPTLITDSIHVSGEIFRPEKFDVRADSSKSRAIVRVMSLENSVITREHQAALPVENGSVLPDLTNDILKVAVIERHNNTGKVVVGFLHGFGLKSGAIVCSHSWEIGNPMVIVGTNDEDMATAVNRAIRLHGGLIVAVGGVVVAEVSLSIGGCIPPGPLEESDRQFKELNEVMAGLGCSVSDPFITLQTIPGAWLPFFRITLEGFINVKEHKVVDLILDER